MSKLPLLEKNSYLKIYFGSEGIYANLAYTDYNADRAYILNDFSEYPEPDQILNNPNLWTNYLQSLEDSLSWDIMGEGNASSLLNDFVDEGHGVKGVKIFIDQSLKNSKKILNTFRNEISQASIETADKEYYTKLFDNFMDKFGYKEVIWVDLGLTSLRVEQFLNDYDGLDKNNLEVTRKLKHKRLINESASRSDLKKTVSDSTIQSFLFEETRQSNLEKQWLNYINTELLFTSSSSLKDLIRSILTVRLLSNLKKGTELKSGFGSNFTKPKGEGVVSESALVVTGSLTRILDQKQLLLALLDGMELDGHLDMFVDKNNEILTFGESYFYGINSQDIILNKAVAIPNPTKIVIPKIPRKKEKAIMNGNLESSQVGRTEIFALSSKIKSFDMTSYKGAKAYLEFRLINGAHLEDLGEKVEFYFDPDRLNYERIVFDCRIKPVIYGPEARKNKIRLEDWFDNE